jgi:hypothetical protein
MAQQQTPASDTGNPPEAFVERVKDILEHLYDFPYLQRHPLWENIDDLAGDQVQQVRNEILTAIEDLSPGLDVPSTIRRDTVGESNSARVRRLGAPGAP